MPTTTTPATLRLPGLLAVAPLVAGCLAAPEEEVSTAALAVTVGDHVRGGCSTAPVLALSRQIADEITCMEPEALASFAEGGGITFTGSAVLPYLAPDARDALIAAAAEGPIEVISAFRTLPQQYLLRRWYEARRCGITAAAQPGRSNHESGRALDIGNRGSAIGRMRRNGWEANVAGDLNHFEHLASDDIRGLDVLAFQRLWNRNHPEDIISEDGDFGGQTSARLLASPAAGFELGASCGDDPVARTITIDDRDARFATSGTWTSSTNVAGYFASGYRVLGRGRTGSATWTLALPAAGRYEVWALYPAAGDRNPETIFQVSALDGADPVEVTVDERTSGPKLLGTFALEPSASVTLVVDEPAASATIADAIKIVPSW